MTTMTGATRTWIRNPRANKTNAPPGNLYVPLPVFVAVAMLKSVEDRRIAVELSKSVELCRKPAQPIDAMAQGDEYTKAQAVPKSF